ncbi:hypothetical protein [Pseudomonas jessenii]|uniref:hypothetical protein n=1 Tax=Pseudomonas jessenii TaxID=77298 RepID=UPI0011B68CED|nr:hypothetical protein [Pseudomonas jessenii]
MTSPKLIAKDISIDHIEDLYRQYGDGSSFSIPNGFKTLRIGLTSRLSQFFITQEKKYNSPLYFSWVNPENQNNTSDIIADPICLTALLMAEEIIGENKKPIKRDLSSLLVKRFDTPVFRKGRQIQMLAIDHSIDKYAKPECFYYLDNEVKIPQTASYYFDIVQEYLKKIAKDSKLRTRDYIGIGELLAELVDNTDQHGRSDYAKGISSRSVRAAILNSHLIPAGADASSICGENNSISSYIDTFRRKKESFSLLEISVFDSGPGVYKSFPKSKTQPSLLEESEVVTNCFKNGITSKPNGIGLGRGLDRARKILNDRQGYLSIRTGRLAMYRDFRKNPISEQAESDAQDVQLFDELTGKQNIFSEMSEVEGVSYIILVPLK